MELQAYKPIVEEPIGLKGEIVALRTKTGKVFDMGGEKRRVEQRIGPVHYPDPSDGRWRTIDVRFVQKGNKYLVDKTVYDLEIDPSKLQYSFTRKKGGHVSVRLTHIDNTPIVQLPLNITPEIENDKLHLRAILPDLDFYFRARSCGVDTFKILKSGSAPRKFTWEVREQNAEHIIVKTKTSGVDNADKLPREFRKVQARIKMAHIVGEKILVGNEYVYSFSEEFTGKIVEIDKKTRVPTYVDNAEIYPIIIDADVDEKIPTDNDDGTEIPPNTWQTYYPKSPGRHEINVGYSKHTGYRFTSVAVPQGATIDDAILTVYVHIGSNNVAVTVYGDDVDDAAAWAGNDAPSDMTNTTASQAKTFDSGIGDDTIDVTSIIQEIVSRGSWLSGNALRMGFIGSSGGYDYFYDYNGGTTLCARLAINYTEGNGAVAPTGALHGPLVGPLGGPI